MNLIAQIEAEQIASLGKTIPDFKAGDTVRVGYKVTEGTRSRVQNYEGVVIGRKGGATISASFTVRKISASAKVWSVCSRSIRPTSTRSRSSVVAACAAPSCTTCVTVAANLPASRKTPPTKPKTNKERDDETGHPPRISRDRRQDDGRHRVPDQDRPGARKATRWRSTSTRWRTRPGPAARPS